MPGSGGWRGSTRRIRLPPDWPTIRHAVLERDHHTCQLRLPGCTGRATDADHIQHGDNHAMTNLQAACQPCHRQKSAAEGGRAWAARRAEGRHPREKHPGLR